MDTQPDEQLLERLEITERNLENIDAYVDAGRCDIDDELLIEEDT